MSNKLIEIIKKLIAASERGERKWDETTEPGMFQTSFPEYSLAVFTKSARGENDYFVHIYDGFGRLVESTSDVELHATWDESYQEMKKLYEMARRNALGVDDALDKILKNL